MPDSLEAPTQEDHVAEGEPSKGTVPRPVPMTSHYAPPLTFGGYPAPYPFYPGIYGQLWQPWNPWQPWHSQASFVPAYALPNLASLENAYRAQMMPPMQAAQTAKAAEGEEAQPQEGNKMSDGTNLGWMGAPATTSSGMPITPGASTSFAQSQPLQYGASPSASASFVPTPATSGSLAAQASSSQPSVQVVVQPSQPLQPVQAPAPAPAMPALPAPVQYYPSTVPSSIFAQTSGPIYVDELACTDPDLATGGRVAGSTILGLLSIPFSLFAPIGILFSLSGLHLANTYLNNGGGRIVGNFARFFNIVGLILAILITVSVALYIGYSAGQDGFRVFGEDPIAFINNSQPMQWLYDAWNYAIQNWPWK